jgi:hypothetical protein
MNTRQRPDTVIFVHLPKTAGTTLHSIINRQYSRDEIHAFTGDAVGSVAAFKAMPDEEKQRIKLLQGHMPFGLDAEMPQQAAYFTMLRDPVDRVISEFYFAIQTPTHYLHDEIKKNRLTLRDAIEGKVHVMLNDAQTRLISGVWGQVPFGKLTSEHLETAKQNLSRCDVVGLMERFDESILMLKKAFGWGDIGYRPKNVTRKRPARDKMDASTFEIIRQAHQNDMALYEFAQGLFAEQKRKYGVSALDLMTFRAMQRLRALRHRARGIAGKIQNA